MPISADKKVYFISDLHLGAGTEADRMNDERRAVALLDSLKTKASAIFLLGDILDYWFEYRHAVPRGFVRFFGKLAELADSGIMITWLGGNHDLWGKDYLIREMGVRYINGSIEETILGQRFFLSHGDMESEDRFAQKLMGHIFRSKVCRLLYAAVHPRWTIPLASGCSSASRNHFKERLKTNPEVLKEMDKAAERLAHFAEYHYINSASKPQYYVFGHLHRASERELPSGSRMVVLGSGVGDKIEYHEFDGDKMRILTFPE